MKLEPPVMPEPEVVAESVDSSYEFPVTFAQQRLWFLDRLQPGDATYLVPWSYRLRGVLDTRALEQALDTIEQRHEVLRTTFTERDGEPLQVVHSSRSNPLPLIDLGAAAEPEQQARAFIAQEKANPFDLAAGPLFRKFLLRLGAQDHVLFLTLHHIISDAWSNGVLARELVSLYRAFASGGHPNLADLAIQYGDYAVWQRQFLSGPTLARQVAYWKHKLEGAPAVLDLPVDHPRPAVQSFRGARKQHDLPKGLAASLTALSREQNVTMFMVLLGGFSVMLGRYAGQDEVVVGSPIAGRNRVEIENLIGFFVNTLVLRTSLEGNPTFRELLGRVRETTMEAYAHQDLPFEKLVEELQPERDLSRNPLFQVMLAFQNAGAGELQLAGLEATPFGAGAQTSKFDLTLFATEHPGGLRLTFEYNTDLFEAATIDRMLVHLETLLASAAEAPNTRVGELRMLPEAEQTALLQESAAAPLLPLRSRRCTNWLRPRRHARPMLSRSRSALLR